ncbi:hypothetical protein J2Q11_08495 [Tenacibaculum finnmarkense genomovar finnmarkense]|uniref:hypothetical protein n=1 Tax=Tenacibaculum finnmarkense TaxID=2781243 RepID=UPI001E2F25AD|nr:hypothetical protein [Tenacibaculum finnmarkense]MCD8417653.1 hypothetical protein [Tenacibaculum finnmarkense genomovar finnmarkense]MCG8186098.1 hypothetical protein [Tenacibaculum finnmarkense genomovar finnmarkense]MCG8202651.1 hypothetical protein [Tenacibaculum finnmarkense genomovar finnmarkense]MCG8210045.1 hypothetical protein [Tenacibaculum finnmarkense genomovar finnmarkense]MCG8212792.1 hypothetical protein [Tenacibaculum finnmarkense genomovar finnmarkense]
MILKKQVEGKTILWLQKKNQYIVVEPVVAQIITLLNNSVSNKEIARILADEISVPEQELIDFIQEIANNILSEKKDDNSLKNNIILDVPQKFEYHYYYKMNTIIIKVSYLSDYEKYLVHPKFAHLEIEKPSETKETHHYRVYSNEKHISFSIDNNIIDTWVLNEVHYFQGKFSMKIVEHIHRKEEAEWLGVFHASAISNGKESMLFLGDSGNGKSTSLALLQAKDFTCLADDFVPIDAEKKHIYSFPSAISIKKNSLPTLLPMYPELETSAEYNFERLGKIVRYLVPNNTDYQQHLPCKALIFIKYEKDSDLQVDKISKLKAFEQLVPDSWLSPITENADKFMDWFEKLPCYQLTYSNNKKMIDTVHLIFNDKL